MANTKWTLDLAHSEILFKVKHLMITTVTGNFKKFDVTAETADAEFKSVESLAFTADTDSIDTNNEQRNGHLKSADFFDAEKFPQISFSSKGFTNTGETTITGDLTIKGVTKPVSFTVEFGGIAVDPYGQTKAGFTISGKINRKDFDLTWGAVTEAGNVVVSDEVKFQGEIQLIKQA